MKYFLILLAIPYLASALRLPAYNELTPRKNTHTTVNDKELLLSCPGAKGSSKIQRADRCTLIKIKNNKDKLVWKNLGSPQLNCAGGTTPTSVTLGGSTSVSETTTVDVNMGISFEGISIGGGMSSSNTKTHENSKSITYQVPPGRQAILMAGFMFHSQTGNVQVNYGDRVNDHYIWFTGARVTKLIPTGGPPQYQIHESKCGTDPLNVHNKS